MLVSVFQFRNHRKPYLEKGLKKTVKLYEHRKLHATPFCLLTYFLINFEANVIRDRGFTLELQITCSFFRHCMSRSLLADLMHLLKTFGKSFCRKKVYQRVLYLSISKLCIIFSIEISLQ